MKQIVALSLNKNNNNYPGAPFSPQVLFPELKKLPFNIETQKDNYLYSCVRDILFSMGLDEDNFGKKEWNPFKKIVSEGDSIVIKPNLVLDEHFLGLEGISSMITHASIVRPIIDYLLIASNNNCKITICDVPLQSANWDRLINFSGFKDLVGYYKEKKYLLI